MERRSLLKDVITQTFHPGRETKMIMIMIMKMIMKMIMIMIMIRWEFIQQVLNTRPEQYDEHYRPVYILCATCAFKYNFILKYELINVEEPLFIQEMEASGLRFLRLITLKKRFK